MNNSFASSEFTAGQLNALVKKMGGPEMARRFLKGDLVISERPRQWREVDGIIYLSVTSDGTSGPGWIKRLEKKGFRLNHCAKSALYSPDFMSTKDVTTEIAILKGVLFEDDDRVISKTRAFAVEYKMTTPNAEVACLIREKFSDEDIKAMGLHWIATMHKPINYSNGDSYLLSADRRHEGRWLLACCCEHEDKWHRESGCAFVVPKASDS